MLPSLCAAFLAGLVAGAFFPFFPITLFVVLLVLLLVVSTAERAGFLEPSSGLAWSSALCLGVIYWTLTAASCSVCPGDELQEESRSEYTGRVVSLVQHAPARMTMLVLLDGPAAGALCGSKIRLNWRDPGEAVYAGDQVVFRGRLHRPTGSLNPRVIGCDHTILLEAKRFPFTQRGVVICGLADSYRV